jgi:hypothetical protein
MVCLLGSWRFRKSGKCFEEAGRAACGSVFELLVPALEKCAQVVAQPRQLEKSHFGRREFLGGECSHLAAGRGAPFTFFEDDGQFGERETEGQGPAHEKDTGERGVGIDPIVVGGTRGFGENAYSLVVPERIRAYPGPPCEFS